MHGSGEWAIDPGLRAVHDQRVRIDHRALAHVATSIAVHRRHAGHALTEIAAIADRRAAGNYADVDFRRELSHRIG